MKKSRIAWVDLWWFSIWTVIFALLVSSWVQAQTLEPGGIFADGFESGDACAWTSEGCAPPAPEYPSTCGPGNVQENLSPLEDNGDGTCSWWATCSKGGTTLRGRVTQPCGGGGQ